MDTADNSLTLWSFALAAAGYAVLVAYLLAAGGDWRSNVRTRRISFAALLSAGWAVASMISAENAQAISVLSSTLLDTCRYGAWYGFLVSILTPVTDEDGAKPSPPSALIQACWLIVASGIAIQIALIGAWIKPEEWLRMLIFHGLASSVIALILVEQLFRSVSADSIWNVKPLCLGLLFQFGFDLYLFSDAMMFNRIDHDALTVRGFVHVITLPLLILSSERSKDWTSKIRFSQKAVFHSITLLLAGVYLLFVAGVGYYVRYFGGDWGRAFQLALVFAGLLTLGTLLVSGSMRAKIRVLVGKHFFHYRYDYREEWLRFTQTLTAQDSPQSMGEQVIRGLANMVESPAGGLWLREAGQDSYVQTARWNLPESTSRELQDSVFCQFLISSGWVVNMEEYRCFPARYGEIDIPEWLSAIPNAWLIVPLMIGHDMQGFVVLASARTAINVNWEVNDLLRTAGCQAASFLAKMQATEALLEVRKFDAFNKMSAFVVHDLKNIVTQLSLMLKNAERHRNNPEFQQDMLMTVDHAVERMRQLMLQLREGAKPPGGLLSVSLADILARIQKDKMKQGRAIDLECHEHLVARGHSERLERVFGHLVQNALDASAPDGKVWVNVRRKNDKAQIEIGDNGHGMSKEFIRDRLFKPFQSTKESGMGIGAYESAQYIRELGGEMLVESEPGQGTCITVLLPLFLIRTESDLRERVSA